MAYAEDSESEEIKSHASEIFYLCKHNNSSRWLRVYKLKNGRCNTQYSKSGTVQIVGSAIYFVNCEKFLNNVKRNLESGGYTCTRTSSHSVLEL